jgi:hypothetical protein
MHFAMIRTKRLPRRVRWAMLGLFAIGLPACRSPEGRPGGWLQQQPGDSSNLVYRPIFSFLERERPFYLSNYAGDDQGPTRPRRVPMGGPAMVPADSPPNVTLHHGSWDSE